jgi:hypothetical protein
MLRGSRAVVNEGFPDDHCSFVYTDDDLEEMIAAQEKFLDAVGFESGSVQ